MTDKIIHYGMVAAVIALYIAVLGLFEGALG